MAQHDPSCVVGCFSRCPTGSPGLSISYRVLMVRYHASVPELVCCSPSLYLQIALC